MAKQKVDRGEKFGGSSKEFNEDLTIRTLAEDERLRREKQKQDKLKQIRSA